MKKIIQNARKLVAQGDEFIALKGLKNFHLKARELLDQAQLYRDFNYQDLIEASFEDSFVKHQNYPSMQFSDLPLTLARGENCFVDLYFWRRRPTVIHDHHFVGAFQCLLGNNVDLEYEFVNEEKVGKHHSLGSLKLRRSKQLKQGDSESIALLDKYIHQNHHQAELTVNVSFRTPELPGKHLSNYLHSGLRFQKHPQLLARTSRLFAFAQMDEFDFKKLKINLDDALYFLLQSQGNSSQNFRLLKLRSYLDKKVKAESGLNVSQLVKQHESKLSEMEAEYE